MAEISPDSNRLKESLKENQDNKKNAAADKAGANLASEASKPGSTHSLDTSKISEQAGSSSKSVTLPHLEIKGDLKQSPDLIKSLSRKALKNGLSSEEYAALAKALIQTKDESVAKAIRNIFKEIFLNDKTPNPNSQSTKAEISTSERHQVKQVSEALTGLYEALNSKDIPQENLKQLATLYSLGADSPLNKFIPDPENRLGDIGGDFKRQSDQSFSKALTGSVNQSDLQILVALTHGAGQSNSNANPFVRDKDDKYVPGDSLAKQARDLLTQLALNPENRSKILALLTDEKLNQLLPDKSHGLETLGLIAAQDPTNLITSDLRKQLQEGLLSNSSRRSAQAGMLAIASYLNDSDITALAKHIVPEDLREAIRSSIDSISGKRLANELATVLVNPEKMEVKENAALALKELAFCATPNSVAALTSLRGKEAQEKLEQKENDLLISRIGINLAEQQEQQTKFKQDIQKLQDTTGDALLEIARTSPDKDTRNNALRAFAEHSYHNKDHQFTQHVQEVLERNPENVSMHRLALKLGTELPLSTSDVVRIATIFGNYDPKVSDGFLTALTQNAINNYGEEKVVTIAQRIALYNSLTPELRKELLGADAKQFDDQSLGHIEPSVVLGQLSNKTFGSPSSPSYFLSQDLEGKVAALRTHEQEQVQKGMKELIALTKLKDASLKDLGNHSAEGIGWYSKLLSSINLSDAEHKFIQSQQAHLTNIKDIDLALKAKEKSVQKAAIQDNLLAIAQGNEQFVSLVKEGKIKQADQLALELLTKNGRDVLISAQDLSYVVTVSKEDAHVSSPALTHLQEEGKTQFAQLPLLLPGETKKGLEVLASIKPNRAYDPATGEFKEKSFVDSEMVRNEALRAIDHDPALLNAKKLAQTISQHSSILTTQLEAAEHGGAKFHSYIEDARKHGEAIKTALEDVSPKYLEQLGNLKTQIQSSLDQPKEIQDQQARVALTNRAHSIDNLLAMLDKDYKLPAKLVKHKGVLEADLASLDKKLYNGEWKDKFPQPGEPSYKPGMTEGDLHNVYLNKRHEILAQLRGINAGTARAQLDKMSVDLSRPEFEQESTFKTWLKKDGVEILGSAAGVAGAIALEVATFGEATPLLAALVATGGGMFGAEVTKEGQYYAGLLNQGSLGGTWYRGEGILQEDGSLKSLNLFDVSSSYGSQLLVGTASNLVASGIGGKLGEVLGKMSGQARAAFMAENQETLAALAKTSAKLEALAAKDPNFAALLKREFLSQFRFTGSTEAIEKTDLFEQAKKSLGEAEGISAFLLNIGLSTAHSGYRNYSIGKVTYHASRQQNNKSILATEANRSSNDPILEHALGQKDKPFVQVEYGPRFDMDRYLQEANDRGSQIRDLRNSSNRGSRIAYGEDGTGSVFEITPHGDTIEWKQGSRGTASGALGKELVSSPAGGAPDVKAIGEERSPTPKGDKAAETTPKGTGHEGTSGNASLAPEGNRAKDAPVVPGSDTTITSETRLKALTDKGDIPGLVEFAGSVNDRKLALAAFNAILDHEPDNQIEILRRLARSDSHAARWAMQELVEAGMDTNIAFERLQKGNEPGGFIQLLKNGQISASVLMSILAEGDHPEAAANQLMGSLNPHPDLKGDLCKVLLEKGKTASSRSSQQVDLWTIPNATEQLRHEALEYLLEHKPAGYEAVLDNLITSSNQQLASQALTEIIKLWSSEVQKPANEQSVSELLLGKRVEQSVKEYLGIERWTDGQDAQTIYKNWLEAKKQSDSAKEALVAEIIDHVSPKFNGDSEKALAFIDDNWNNHLEIDRMVQERSRDNPDVFADYQKVRELEAETNQHRKVIDEINQERTRLLMTQLTALAQEMRLPKPTLELVPEFQDSSTKGKYSLSEGKISVLESLAISEKPDFQLLRTAIHELVHQEQDVLVIRRLADELKIGATTDVAEREQIKQQYRQRIGNYPIADVFFDDVLRMRNGNELTEGQTKRADSLIKSFREMNEEQMRRDENKNLMRRLIRIKQLEESGYGLSIILGSSNPSEYHNQVKKIMGMDNLPKNLSQALDALVQAEAEQSPNRKELEDKARQELKSAVFVHGAQVSRNSHKTYVTKPHEQESHEAAHRVKIFARYLQKQRLKQSDQSTDSKDGSHGPPPPGGSDKPPGNPPAGGGSGASETRAIGEQGTPPEGGKPGEVVPKTRAGGERSDPPKGSSESSMPAGEGKHGKLTNSGGELNKPLSQAPEQSTSKIKSARPAAENIIDTNDPVRFDRSIPPEQIIFDFKNPQAYQFQKGEHNGQEGGKVYEVSMMDQGVSRQVIVYIPSTYVAGKSPVKIGLDGVGLKDFNPNGWLANKWDVLAERTGAALIVPKNVPSYGNNHILYKALGTHLNDWNYGQPEDTKTNLTNQKDPVDAFYALGQKSITRTRSGFNDTVFVGNLFDYLEKNTNIKIGDQGVDVVSFSSGTILAQALLNNPSTKDRVRSMVLGCPTNFYPKQGPLETRSIEVLCPGKEDVPMLAFLGGKDKLVPPAGGPASKSYLLFLFGHTNLRDSQPWTAVVVRALRNGGDGSYKVIEDTPGYQVREFKARSQAPTKVVIVDQGAHRNFGRRSGPGFESSFSHNSPEMQGDPDAAAMILDFWTRLDRTQK